MSFQKSIVASAMFFVVACNSQTKEDMLSSGLALLRAGDMRGSITCFKNALQKDVNFYEARYYLADAYLRSGRLELAESEFAKISLYNSSFFELPVKFSQIYLLTSRNELAIQTLEQYHLIATPTSESLDILGRAYAVFGNYKKADSSFQKAIELSPENPYPKFHQAESYMNQSRTEEALQLLLSVVNQQPNFVPGYQLLARIELNRRHYPLALDLFRRLYELDPMNSNAIYLQGFLLVMSNQLDEARKISVELSQKFPADYRASLLRGLISYHQGSFEIALVDLITSLKISQKPVTYYFLGLSYFSLGNFELSISQFQKVLDVEPFLSQARLMLAEVFLQQKRIDDCIREVKYVLANDDRNGLAYILLGCAQLLDTDYEAAKYSFAWVVENSPELINSSFNKNSFFFANDKIEFVESSFLDVLPLSQEIFVELEKNLEAGNFTDTEKYKSLLEKLKA